MFIELILWLKQKSVLSIYAKNLNVMLRAVDGSNLSVNMGLSVGKISMWLTPCKTGLFSLN